MEVLYGFPEAGSLIRGKETNRCGSVWGTVSAVDTLNVLEASFCLAIVFFAKLVRQRASLCSKRALRVGSFEKTRYRPGRH